MSLDNRIKKQFALSISGSPGNPQITRASMRQPPKPPKRTGMEQCLIRQPSFPRLGHSPWCKRSKAH